MTNQSVVSILDFSHKASYNRPCMWLRLFSHVVLVCCFKYNLGSISVAGFYAVGIVYCSGFIEN